MTRLPIRLRVTLAFAGAMAVLLASLSAFLVIRVERQLDLAVRQGLESRAADLGALVKGGTSTTPDVVVAPLSDEDASIAQVLDAQDRVVDATPVSPRRPLLGRADLATARGKPLFVDVRLGSEDTPARLLATATGEPGTVVIVGQSLETRDEAVQQLKAQLAVGAPIVLIIASLVGYLAAAAALRPVRAMSRQAREIESAALDTRLTVPVAQDEIAELGTTLNAMLDRVAATLEHERGFIADASHELRTPLAIIAAEIHVALETVRDERGYRDALLSLAAQHGRVVRLAEALLVLARADQNRLPMRAEPLDAATAVTACADRFAASAEQAGLRLVCEVEPDLFVLADEIRVDQLLDNVVENALRYAEREIRLGASRVGDAAVIRVRDDGPGFPPAFAARAFDRFAVAEESRTGGHAGLGLSIVEAIARAHGWTVSLPSGEGGGAVVEVRMPTIGAVA